MFVALIPRILIKKNNCVSFPLNATNVISFYPMYIIFREIEGKIEKVPRGIRGQKSSKDMASSRNLVSTIGAQASPTMGDGTRCPEGKAFPAGMPHPLQMLHRNQS